MTKNLDYTLSLVNGYVLIRNFSEYEVKMIYDRVKTLTEKKYSIKLCLDIESSPNFVRNKPSILKEFDSKYLGFVKTTGVTYTNGRKLADADIFEKFKEVKLLEVYEFDP